MQVAGHSCIYPFMATEIETKLIVLADDPESTMDEIACCQTLGGYRISPSGVRFFTDTYFDSQERSLTLRGIAVRTRESDGSVVFCIKEDERIMEDGSAHRKELEMPWSEECLEHASRIMNADPAGTEDLSSGVDTPAASLAGIGLFPIQMRHTRRGTFDISIPGVRKPLAELAMDAVCYRIADVGIFHYEVEVESKKPGFESETVRFTDILKASFPGRLMRWDHNKLITGMSMEQLLREGRISTIPGKVPCLGRSAYDVIDAFLRARI